METATAAVQNHDLYKNPEYYTTGALQPMWTGGYHYQSPALAHTLDKQARRRWQVKFASRVSYRQRDNDADFTQTFVDK